MSVRGWAPGKELVSPRGMWSALAQKRKGSPARASFMQNARVSPGIVASRPGTSPIPAAAVSGMATGLFNWVAPSGNNYVLYRDATAIKAFLQQGAVSSTVFSGIGSTLRPSYADLDIWLYMAGYDTAGNATFQCRIYDGTHTDKAFRGPVTLTAFSASDGGAGQCSIGTHFVGFVYQNRTGFIGAPTNTLAGVPLSATLSTDLRKINISVTLPAQADGGGDAALYLIMTRADNPSLWYFMPTDATTGAIGSAPVPLSTISTLSFVANLSDADIADSLAGDTASEQFLLLTQDGSGNGPFLPSAVVPYGQRMCYVVGTSLYVSDINNPQHLTADQHVVTMPNKRVIAYAFPLPGSTDLFLTGDRWTARVTDNSDVPATWAQPILVSDSIGAPFPACVCYRTRGGYVWVVTEAGIYLFTGTYAERPVTYLCSDQWARINWAAAYAVEIADDVVGLRLYVAVPLDGATTPSHLFCIDYTSGLDFDQVDISLDVFAQSFSSIAVIKDLQDSGGASACTSTASMTVTMASSSVTNSLGDGKTYTALVGCSWTVSSSTGVAGVDGSDEVAGAGTGVQTTFTHPISEGITLVSATFTFQAFVYGAGTGGVALPGSSTANVTVAIDDGHGYIHNHALNLTGAQGTQPTQTLTLYLPICTPNPDQPSPGGGGEP